MAMVIGALPRLYDEDDAGAVSPEQDAPTLARPRAELAPVWLVGTLHGVASPPAPMAMQTTTAPMPRRLALPPVDRAPHPVGGTSLLAGSAFLGAGFALGVAAAALISSMYFR